MTRGLITLEDHTGTQTTIVIEHVVDKASLSAIVDFVRSKSEAKIVSYIFEDITFVPADTANHGGAYDTVEQSLNMKYQNGDTGEYVSFVLPAPGQDTLNDQQLNTDIFASDVRYMLEHNTTHATLLYRRGGLNSMLPTA